MAAVLFWSAAGALLVGPEVVMGNTLWAQMLSMFGRLPRVLVANWDFAGWQLAWAAHGSMPTQILGSAVHPVRKSLLDFGLSPLTATCWLSVSPGLLHALHSLGA